MLSLVVLCAASALVARVSKVHDDLFDWAGLPETPGSDVAARSSEKV